MSPFGAVISTWPGALQSVHPPEPSDVHIWLIAW